MFTRTGGVTVGVSIDPVHAQRWTTGSTVGTSTGWNLAVEIARLLGPDGLARLAADHVDDGHGHCRVCPAGGIGTGRKVWPCDLAVEAQAAARTSQGSRHSA